MIYCFDLDGTLCTSVENSEYDRAVPIDRAIQEVNRLFEKGNRIIIHTGRGSSSGKDWRPLTESQLELWGLKYHYLIVGNKVIADIYVDDKGVSAAHWRAGIGSKQTTGFLAGTFDLLHPGYIKAFREAKQHCDRLVLGLHDNAAHERPHKLPPVLSIEDREQALRECRSIDEVYQYKTEADLLQLLVKLKPTVRFLGDDYRNKPYTGEQLAIPIVYIDRSHGFSLSSLKKSIAATVR